MTCHSDACCQGRKPCPTPQACELAENDPYQILPAWTIFAGLLVMALLGAWVAI
jgi:hypothetical protein